MILLIFSDLLAIPTAVLKLLKACGKHFIKLYLQKSGLLNEVLIYSLPQNDGSESDLRFRQSYHPKSLHAHHAHPFQINNLTNILQCITVKGGPFQFFSTPGDLRPLKNMVKLQRQYLLTIEARFRGD